jgi:hypothetical protein
MTKRSIIELAVLVVGVTVALGVVAVYFVTTGVSARPKPSPIDNASVLAYVQQVLVPHAAVRRRRRPRQPRRPQATGSPSRRSAPWAQPSDSCRPTAPIFNPIELAFAKLKAFLRTSRRRTFDHGHLAEGVCARALHSSGMCELHPPLRLSHSCADVKNALNEATSSASTLLP